MAQEYEQFGNAFCACLVSGDLQGAYGHLASWLQASMTPDEFRAALPVTAVKEYEVDWNSSTYDELKTPDGAGPPSRPFPPEITGQNFSKWMCIQLRGDDPSEEAPIDVWMALVSSDGGLRIGYFEVADAD